LVVYIIEQEKKLILSQQEWRYTLQEMIFNVESSIWNKTHETTRCVWQNTVNSAHHHISEEIQVGFHSAEGGLPSGAYKTFVR